MLWVCCGIFVFVGRGEWSGGKKTEKEICKKGGATEAAPPMWSYLFSKIKLRIGNKVYSAQVDVTYHGNRVVFFRNFEVFDLSVGNQ